MPEIQTSYETNIAVAYEGMLGDSRDHDVVSRLCESADGIGYGKPVFKGTSDRQVKSFEDRVEEAFIGITEASHHGSEGLRDLYAQYEEVSVVQRGPIWVMADDAVVAGAPAYMTTATGVFTDDATDGELVGRWETSTTDAGLALLYVHNS